MDIFACALIDSLGGTVKVAELIEGSTSTVQSWKTIGIPRSRLAHLKLIADRDGIAIDWSTGERIGGNVEGPGHEAANIADRDAPASGKSGEISTRMERVA